MSEAAAAGPVLGRSLRALGAATELAEIFRRGRNQGFVLLSDLQAVHDPIADPPDWLERLEEVAADLGVEIVDDLADAAAPAAAAVTGITTDSVRHYLNAIGRTPLLTAEQEFDLAKRYQAGLHARELIADPAVALSPAVRARLHRIDTDGRRAQEHMVRANLRLVVSIARRYRGRGLDLLDLVQEGNLGLIRGVEKFDHTKGYKFSTYATWWIRQALTRGLADKARTMRLPVHVHEVLGKIRWTELDLVQALGRDPTEAEVAEALGLQLSRLREIQAAARDPLSLDTPVAEDNDATRGTLVADEDAVDPEGAAALAMTRLLLEDVLSTLSDRERSVVELRFGLADGETRTLEEIGGEYGVTRERIRQIEARTLTKLRHPSRADRLEGLLQDLDGMPPPVA